MNFLLKLLLPIALIVFVARWIIQRVGDFGGAAAGLVEAGAGKIAEGHEAAMVAIEKRAGAYGQRRGERAAGQRFGEIISSPAIAKAVETLQSVYGRLKSEKARTLQAVVAGRDNADNKARIIRQIFGGRPTIAKIANYLRNNNLAA